MNGKDVIIERILKDAQDAALLIRQRAQSAYDEALNAAKKKADEMVKACKEEVAFDKEETLRRRKVVASLDGKKVALSARTKAVDEVFLRVLSHLNNMEKSAYKAFIDKLLVENAQQKDCVILAKNSPLSVDDVLMLSVSKERQLSARKDGNFNGGIVLESKDLDLNLSFEALVSVCKEANQTKVAEELFGD